MLGPDKRGEENSKEKYSNVLQLGKQQVLILYVKI